MDLKLKMEGKSGGSAATLPFLKIFKNCHFEAKREI
jgi:hypothetical protein